MNRHHNSFFTAIALLAASAFSAHAADSSITLSVDAKSSGADVPVSVAVELPKALADVPAEEIDVLLELGNGKVPGQIMKCGDKTKLVWIIPKIDAGNAQEWTATFSRGQSPVDRFQFEDTPGKTLDLLFGGRKVMQYFYPFDMSTPESVFATYKPFHHVFDAAGDKPITQGNDGKKFPHHRALFIGFSKLTAGNNTSGDYWHMRNRKQQHQKHLEMAAGPVAASSTALIHWITDEGGLAVKEERQVTAYRQSGPAMLLIDFESRLTAPGHEVVLHGDPEHAGMQFRAHGDIDTGKTKYTYPEGIDAVQGKLDLPWTALSMSLKREGDPRYTIQHMNHAANPKGTKYSAYRDYGRFGAFPSTTIAADDTLTLRYRIWVAQGDAPSIEQLQSQADNFNAPPVVTVK
jgi:hypothetical protein